MKESMMTKIGKIGRINGRACEWVVADNATVEDLLAVAEEDLAKGEQVVSNGAPVKLDLNFYKGQEFIIMPSTTGA